jgi:hypothetical protein
MGQCQITHACGCNEQSTFNSSEIATNPTEHLLSSLHGVTGKGNTTLSAGVFFNVGILSLSLMVSHLDL